MGENRLKVGMKTRRTLTVVMALTLAAAAGCETGSALTDAGVGGSIDAALLDSCGNEICETGEACESCPEDCPQCVACPDQVCDAFEDCTTCPADCGACPSECGNGDCETGESCEFCPEDCTDCATCPDGMCDSGEDCTTCSADCGECPADCGGAPCAAGEQCVEGPSVEPFCTTCDPDACAAFGVICCPHNADTGECTNLWNDPDHCGACGQACPTGQHCVTQFEPVGAGPFCTNCDPEVCAGFGVSCCPGNAPDGGCTNTMVDSDNCGGCNVVCGPDELCNAGVCELVDTLSKCSFDPMQWWRSPAEHAQRDITFVAIGDVHAADPTPGCSSGSDYAADQNQLAASAINSVIPSIFWEPHEWPPGANFFREGQPYDHVRGLIPLGDLTHAGSESRPAGVQVCREYHAYRDAFGRCGSEGRLGFPVYDVYGNHDFPRQTNPGDASFHPVIDRLDQITAAHRPGAPADLYDHPSAGTGHYAWRWDDIWFVNVNVKPGYLVEPAVGSDDTTRFIDPHSARGFLKGFLMSRSNNPTRQIVILAHYPLSSSRIDDEERLTFCQRLYNAQHASGDFTGQKLSLSNPVVAYIHGHNHHIPEPTSWTCPSPYDSITIPQFSAGDPLYPADNNGGNLHFSIFRLGSNKLEVVGVAAPASDPTGPWSYVYKERLDIMNAP